MRELRGGAQATHESEAGAAIGEGHERKAEWRPFGEDAQRDFGDHAECAFGADEQIHQVHPGLGKISG